MKKRFRMNLTRKKYSNRQTNEKWFYVNKTYVDYVTNA